MGFIKVTDYDTDCTILLNLRYIVTVREAKTPDYKKYCVVKLKDKGLLKIKENIAEMSKEVLGPALQSATAPGEDH